ncbi:MAG: electron transfer flavoprotein subunit alpha/FixB family protein [Saprospiraceae bacterium]|nr:electron transfer flavoprotein subunit alpha/FixB family protein [Saprospiraceae bacterium]
MVLVFAESGDGRIKKSGQEAITFGKKLATQAGTTCTTLLLGPIDAPGDAGIYGADLVVHLPHDGFTHFDSQTWSRAICEVATARNAEYVVLSHSSRGKALTGRVAIRLQAGCVSGVTELPNLSSGCLVTKGVYSGKAFASLKIATAIKVLSVMGNAIQPTKDGTAVPVEVMDLEPGKAGVTFVKTDKVEGTVPLPEAERVVSAGRGMKGPENWGIIEDLAAELGATTACSRPVADSDWRPHHEHVGQTGIAIRPNLYIAIGISGAIQHLAGVNRSKVIVVINKDPEAPFFKAADYGVVGDLFEVVPRLTKAIQDMKAAG